MKKDSVIRSREFRVEELRRQLSQFDRMIQDLRFIQSELGRQIAIEEDRTGVADPAHFAYSTVARAACVRRDKLEATVAGLEAQRQRAEIDLARALDGLHTARMAAEADVPEGTRERARRVRAA